MTACWCSHVVSQVDWFAAYPLGPVVLGKIAIRISLSKAHLRNNGSNKIIVHVKNLNEETCIMIQPTKIS